MSHMHLYTGCSSRCCVMSTERFRGFISRDINYFPMNETSFGVSILVTFASEQDLLNWNTSSERQESVARAIKAGLIKKSSVKSQKRGSFQQIERLTPQTPEVLWGFARLATRSNVKHKLPKFRIFSSLDQPVSVCHQRRGLDCGVVWLTSLAF